MTPRLHTNRLDVLMSKTEQPAPAGNGLPLVQEVKQAMTGFVSEFKGFQGEILTKLQQTEERLNMLDRKSHSAARPHLAATVDDGAPHQKAFNAYIRSGDDDGLRGLELNAKSLSTAVNSDGGYLVDPQTSDAVKSVLYSSASIRAIASAPKGLRPSKAWRTIPSMRSPRLIS